MRDYLFAFLFCTGTLFGALYHKESEIFYLVAKNLRGAKTVDGPAIKSSLTPLLERIKQDNIQSAIPPLEHAVNSLDNPNPKQLYEEIMTSWYFTSPEASLLYLFNEIDSGMNQIQQEPANSDALNVTRVDFNLLLGFLNVLIQKNGERVLNLVVKDLNDKAAWFSETPRRDFVFFQISLELSWLKTILLVRENSLPELVKSIDYQISMQQKIMGLTKFDKEPDYEKAFHLLVAMQMQLCVQDYQGLLLLKPQGPHAKAAEALLKNVVDIAPKQLKDPKAMTQVLENLQQASSILHSL